MATYINQLDIFYLIMKCYQQKEESSYVKRIKLKKSIIKTHQILKTIATHGTPVYQLKQRIQSYDGKERGLSQKTKILTKGKSIVIDTESYKNQLSFSKNQSNNLFKISEPKMAKQEQNRLCNIQIRRIVGDPSHKRQTTHIQNKLDSNRNIKIISGQTFMNLPAERQGVNQTGTGRPPNTYKSQIYSASSVENRYLSRENKSKQENCFKTSSPTKRNKVYLYQRMADSQTHKHRDETNCIYEKRIKSYLQFLWKAMLAHNVYLNLDISNPKISIKKLKVYVGPGNNCNMIKGLIKRRFWWAISDELTEDCVFVWTQLKINKLFQRQQRGAPGKSIYKTEDKEESRRNLIKTSSSTRKRHTIQINSFKAKEKEVIRGDKSGCLWNQKDRQVFLPFVQKYQSYEQRQKWSSIKMKQQSYLAKTLQIVQNCKKITVIQELSMLKQVGQQSKHNYYKVKPIVHNHLQNNFHLGNKKALFYNLQQYYKKVGQDVFHYVPLTFHIKSGFKDHQYKRFVEYYQRRSKIIRKEEETEENTLKKTRNIWIIKPGENSNQGRGITVIDQIYELNSIIKQGQKSNRNAKQQQVKQNEKTYIVQMYIDRPFLYNERKFDIRHYMLITNLYGVTRAYWYEQGYIRTSSYHFNIHNFDPQIHLTNDAIQKHFPDYGKYESANKLSYSQFQNYLNTFADRKYNFKDEILPKMKKIGKDAVRSIYTKMSPNNQLNNFQIFGLDFMIDRNFKPWLIEINTNPCLDCVCPLLDKIIPYMVQQSFKLSLDLVYPPPHHYPNTAKHYAPMINLQTFKYELIFDSLSEGAELQRLYSTGSKNLIEQIGQIEQDEQFNDNGKQIKLQDFT